MRCKSELARHGTLTLSREYVDSEQWRSTYSRVACCTGLAVQLISSQVGIVAAIDKVIGDGAGQIAVTDGFGGV